MAYSIEPAYLVQNELTRLIIKAGTDPVNKWFFTDGAFTPDSQLERTPNTWMHENFVVIENKQVLAYFEAFWNKPLNIITSFRKAPDSRFSEAFIAIAYSIILCL